MCCLVPLLSFLFNYLLCYIIFYITQSQDFDDYTNCLIDPTHQISTSSTYYFDNTIILEYVDDLVRSNDICWM